MELSSLLNIVGGVACAVSVASMASAGIVDDTTNDGLRLKSDIQTASSVAAAVGFAAIGTAAVLSIISSD